MRFPPRPIKKVQYMPDYKRPQTSLINNASKGSHEELDKRDYRYERRKNAQKISKHERFKKCGRTPLGSVVIGMKGSSVQQRGLSTCGSVWACPVCNAKVLSKRSKEIQQALDTWKEQGGHFIFETLTIRHRPWERVQLQRRAIQGAWKAITKGSFKSTNGMYDQVGFFRVAEISSGDKGENLHLHVIRFIDRWLTESEIQEWKSKIFNKWSSSLVAHGMQAPKADFHDFRQVASLDDFAGYLTKNFDNPKKPGEDFDHEQSQDSSTWRILDAAIASPNSSARRRWNNYETDTFRMHQISWSRGLRERLGIGVELSDEELSSDEDSEVTNEEEFVPIVRIKPESVRVFVNLGHVHSRVLRHIQNDDLETALHLLAEHGVEYELFADFLDKGPPDTT
jgi:hypothetical protein